MATTFRPAILDLTPGSMIGQRKVVGFDPTDPRRVIMRCRCTREEPVSIRNVGSSQLCASCAVVEARAKRHAGKAITAFRPSVEATPGELQRAQNAERERMDSDLMSRIGAK